MTEITNHQVGLTNVPNLEVERQHIDVSAHIDLLRDKYPGIEGLSTPGLDKSAAKLIDEFEVRPDFFEGKDAGARTLFLSSLAYRLTKLDEQPVDEAGRLEHTFIGNAMLVLAKDYTDAFPELAAGMESEAGNSASDDHTERVYEGFLQPELTEAAEEIIRDGTVLADIREKMQITPENEDDFRVMALSITADESFIDKLAPSGMPTADDWEQDREGSSKRAKAFEVDLDVSRDWKKGLAAKTEKFKDALGKNVANAAYMTKFNGKTHLILSAPIAERLAYPDDLENRSSFFKADAEAEAKEDVRAIRHEYVHTQGGVHLPGLLIGINAEERRAEHFSGDRMGYQDIKYFFRDVRFVTGFDITAFFDSHPKGGTTEGLFAAVAESTGLGTMPEIMMMPPANYLESQSNSVHQAIVDYLGSYQGVVARLLKEATQDPAKVGAMEDRLEQYSLMLADSTTDDEAFHDIYGPANRRAGSVYFFDNIADRVLEIRSKRGQTVPIPG